MSGTRPDLVYFDACIFIAYLDGDKSRLASDLAAIDYYADRLENGGCRIATSVITRIEVLEGKLPPPSRSRLEAFLKRSDVDELSVTSRVSERAHEIRDFYRAKGPTLSVPDAIHLASATIHGCGEFLTYDGRGERKREDRGLRLLDISPPVAGRYHIDLKVPSVPDGDPSRQIGFGL